MDKWQVGSLQINCMQSSYIHYTCQRSNPTDRTFLQVTEAAGETLEFLVTVLVFIFDNKGKAVCHWKVLRMATEERSSSTGPEMPYVVYKLQALFFHLLRLSPSIRVVSWQAEDKNLNHVARYKVF